MSLTETNPSLEDILRDLPKHGTLIKDRGYRQVWRFEVAGSAHYLKFYPKGGYRDNFRRFFRGSPAMREFSKLQLLQKAKIPAPRAEHVLMGYTLNGQRGDAVILEAIEPAIQLDTYLNEFEAKGESPPDHLKLAKQVIDLILQLGKAKLGHTDLHPGNFLLRDEKLYLLDGYAVRPEGLKLQDLLMLGHSVRRYATLTDLARGWETLSTGGVLPTRNSHSEFLWKRFLDGIFSNNRYFGRIESEGWSGSFFKQTKYPYRWSPASALTISQDDWKSAWPKLLGMIEGDQLRVHKRSPSGDVMMGTITLAGKEIEIVVKRPRRRYWYRYATEIGRGPRPRRAWRKAWNLLVRGIPTAWPLLVMEKKVAGYSVDSIIVCEKIPGRPLAKVELNRFSSAWRENLMHRTGKMLRLIEYFGFSHFDAKASNWMVYEDPITGPLPVMVDVDGVRKRRWIGLGIDRLLRSMHENKQYTPADSFALCRGYAPYANVAAPEKSAESAE